MRETQKEVRSKRALHRSSVAESRRGPAHLARPGTIRFALRPLHHAGTDPRYAPHRQAREDPHRTAGGCRPSDRRGCYGAYSAEEEFTAMIMKDEHARRLAGASWA